MVQSSENNEKKPTITKCVKYYIDVNGILQ